MKKFSMKTIAAIVVGAALFLLLGKISIPTPVSNTYVSLQYAVQAVFATLFGPVAGCLIGLIGHTLIDVTGGGPWWSWIIASACVGLIIGVATWKTDLRSGLESGKLIRFNIAQAAAHLIAWGVIAPCLDIVIYAEPVEKLFAQGLMAAGANILTTAVVGTLLLVVYAQAIAKKAAPQDEER